MQPKELLIEWQQKVHILHRCNAQLAAKNDALGRYLGLAATILSAIVTTSIFSTLTQSDKTILIIVTGLLSIITITVSAAYQYLKLQELSVRYHQAVDLYGKLRREIEIILHETDVNKITKDMLEKISKEWDDLDKKVPPVPNGIYQKVKEEMLKEESDARKNKSTDK
jgi:hypothetical protein